MTLFARLLVSLSLGLPLVAHAGETTRFSYDVWLDDSRIGYYSVEIAPQGGMTRVSIDTELEWTFLSIPLYRYEHRNTELWQGECLRRLESETSDNGDRNFVQAIADGEQFEMQTHQGSQQLQGCVRSFAYWNPALLRSDRLLNSQTGEHTEISIAPIVGSSPQIEGAEGAVTGYRLSLPEASIDLWYSEEMEWLVLQTRVRGDRLLTYVRSGEPA